MTRSDDESSNRITIAPATPRRLALASFPAPELPSALLTHMRGASTSGTQDSTGKRLVKIVVSGVVAALDRIPGRQPLAQRAAGVVLLYHDIPPAEAARFARQLDMLSSAGIPTACTDLPASPDGRWHIAVTFDDGLFSFEHVALPELRARAIPTTMFPISGLLRSCDDDLGPTHEGMPVLTEAAVAGLPAAGHEIGSHTDGHPRLSRLDDAETLEELSVSRARLEAITGLEVTALAFPYGDWTRRTVELAVEAGYERVYTVLPDLVGAPGADPVIVGRIVVAPTDWPIETWLKLRGGYRWVARWGHFHARRAGER